MIDGECNCGATRTTMLKKSLSLFVIEGVGDILLVMMKLIVLSIGTECGCVITFGRHCVDPPLMCVHVDTYVSDCRWS